MFNHLPPLSHEWQTRQSTSSGLRRLNRGNCCTKKFALSFLNTFHKGPPMLKELTKQITFETLRSQIRVLTENDWSVTFDLIYNILVWIMVPKIQMHHFYLIAYINSFHKIIELTDEIWSIDKKVNCTLKSKTLTFWPNLSFKDQNSSRHSGILSLIIKKSRKSKVILKSQNLQDLEILLSVFIHVNFITSWHLFITIQDNSSCHKF